MEKPVTLPYPANTVSHSVII